MNLRISSKAFKKVTSGILTLSMVLSILVISGFQMVNAAPEPGLSVSTPPNIVSLISPDYRSELNGLTALKVAAPGGYTYANAYYTNAPDDENPHPLGHTVTVGPANLDAEGVGTINIDSNNMPNGPVMIMVEAFKQDGTSCTGYFQFFNLVGKEWNAGLSGRDENIPGLYDPEVALPDFINQNQESMGKPAMQTVFADDMNYKDNNDIKAHISRDGIGKTYAAHYPNHKDDRAGFVGPERGDDGGQQYNPFRTTQGISNKYLQMIDKKHDEPTGAADWGGLTKYMTSPCISSINEEGHSASLPEYPEWDGWTNGYTEQYLEARIFFGPNPGTWPAFWTLSNGPWKDPETGVFKTDDEKGRTGWRGTDELDIVEAWHTARSFSINTHMWNYTALDREGNRFGGGIKNFNTMDIMERAGTDPLVGDFHMGFHTYGCYITRDYTYYFLNGELIGKTPTMPLSWRDGNRFLINTGIDATKHQAFPEGYGFTRYGNESHTYVDWVRIWEAPVNPSAPVFDLEYDAMEVQPVKPNETLTFNMDRQNDAAKNSVVTYNVDLPEGWEIVGNNTFGPLKGDNTQDELKLSIPTDYLKYNETIDITPVVDGKEYPVVYVMTRNDDTSFGIDSIYPYYVSEKGTWDVYVKISNADTALLESSKGTITLKSPDGTERVSEFPALAPGEDYLLPPLKDVSLNIRNTEDFVFELSREDGFERTIERKISGLTAVKTDDFDFGNDGTPFDLSQWDGGMVVELDKDFYQGSVPLTGNDDLFVTMYTKWSDKFLYVAAVVADDDNVPTNTDNWGGLWDGDSIQMSFDPTRAKGYANDIGMEHIRLTGGVNNQGVGGFAVETMLYNDYKAQDIQTNFFRDEASKMTYYMTAIPWGAILPHGAPVVDDINATEDIGFSLLINDRDGADSRGWIRYADGIGSGKNPRLFGDLTLTNAETPASVSFADVNDSDWFYGDVNYAVKKGLFKGTSDSTFSPDSPMTRAMFVTVLYRMHAAVPVEAYANPFSDVPDGEYYAEAVKWAASNEIVKGVSPDSFSPDASVSRQDIAVMLERYLNFTGAEFSVTMEYKLFADEDAISDYAKNAVQTMNKLGIITGKGDNIIDPQNSATRAEVAAMLHRFLLIEK